MNKPLDKPLPKKVTTREIGGRGQLDCTACGPYYYGTVAAAEAAATSHQCDPVRAARRATEALHRLASRVSWIEPT